MSLKSIILAIFKSFQQIFAVLNKECVGIEFSNFKRFEKKLSAEDALAGHRRKDLSGASRIIFGAFFGISRINKLSKSAWYSTASSN